MQRRWWIMMALFGAALLLAVPVRGWIQAYGPKQAVAGFIEALKTGDPVSAAYWIHPDHAKALEDSHVPWEPSPRLTYRLQQVQVTGGQATVVAVMRESSFAVNATFTLEQTAAGRWQISEVSSLQPDKSWEAALDAHRRELYARELRDAAQKSPGVIVEGAPGRSRR